MDDLLQSAIEGAAAGAADSGLGPATSANGMVFLAITCNPLAVKKNQQNQTARRLESSADYFLNRWVEDGRFNRIKPAES